RPSMIARPHEVGLVASWRADSQYLDVARSRNYPMSKKSAAKAARLVLRDLVVEIELARPAIGQVQLDLLAQLALGADAIAVADHEHPDHQLRINRGTADLAIKGLELLVNVRQNHRHEHIEPPQQ